MMKIKVGDTVKILAGKDRGKEGKVIKTFKSIDKVSVEGINIVKKHQKPKQTNETGGIFEYESPIHVSNVKVISSAKEEKTKKVKEVKEIKSTKEKAKKEKKLGDNNE